MKPQGIIMDTFNNYRNQEWSVKHFAHRKNLLLQIKKYKHFVLIKAIIFQ